MTSYGIFGYIFGGCWWLWVVVEVFLGSCGWFLVVLGGCGWWVLVGGCILSYNQFTKNFTTFTGKHLCQSLFFNKVAGLRLVTLLKKRLWCRYFPVNFTKFLKASFLQNTSGRLLLILLLLLLPRHLFHIQVMIWIMNFKSFLKVKISLFSLLMLHSMLLFQQYFLSK